MNSLTAIYDEPLAYAGTEYVINNSLPSDFQAEFMGVASFPRSVVTCEGEDLASGTGELLVESSGNSIVDENASGLKKVTETNKPDAVEDGVSGASGDVAHPLVPVLLVPVAGQIMHSSSSSSSDSELRDDYSINVDRSLQSEGDVTVNELLSPDEPVTPPYEADVQGSRVSVLDQPSVYENLENFNGEEPEGVHVDVSAVSPRNSTPDNLIHESLILGLAGGTEVSTPLEMKSEHELGSTNELNESQSKITDEMLSKPEVGFMKNLSNSDKELDDGVHADVSGIRDIDESLLTELDAIGDFGVERQLTLDQGGSSMEPGQFDNILEGTAAETQDIPNHLQDMNEAFSSPAISSEAKFSHLNDEVNSVIDQPGLIKPEVSSFLQSRDDPEMTVYNPKLHVLEACSIEELDSVFKQRHGETDVHPALESTVEGSSTSIFEKGGGELSIAGGSQEPSGTDEELLVLEAKSVEDISSALKQLTEGLSEPNSTEVERLEVLPERSHLEPQIGSDLHVLEACSIEELDSVFKQHHGETDVHHELESTVEDSATSVFGKGDGESSIADRSQKPSGSDEELLVLEAKSVEDISSALKQLTEGLSEPNITEVERLEVLQERSHLEPEVASDLHVIEAKSLEDLDLALKQPSEVSEKNPPDQMAQKDRHIEAGATERSIEPQVDVVQSAEASGKHIEPEHSEVKSGEEIQLDPVEADASQSSMVHISEKSDEIVLEGDVSKPSASTSRKAQKKKSKDSGSDSSSRSGSSSSDSD